MTVLFSPMSVTGYINHTPGQSQCPGVVGQHKTNSKVLFASFGLVLSFFSALLVFCLLILIFSFVACFCFVSFCFFVF